MEARFSFKTGCAEGEEVVGFEVEKIGSKRWAKVWALAVVGRSVLDVENWLSCRVGIDGGVVEVDGVAKLNLKG